MEVDGDGNEVRTRHRAGAEMTGALTAPGGSARSLKSVGVLMNLDTLAVPDGAGTPSGT